MEFKKIFLLLALFVTTVSGNLRLTPPSCAAVYCAGWMQCGDCVCIDHQCISNVNNNTLLN